MTDRGIGHEPGLGPSLRRQLSENRYRVMAIFGTGLLAAIGVYALAAVTGADLPSLTRDPASVTHSHVYTGILSNAGVTLWAACTAICFFGVWLLLRENVGWREVSFLLSSALFTSLLLLDDVLLVHEAVLPKALGVPQYLTYGGYGLLFSFYMIHFARRILESPFLLLIIALFCFLVSMIIDTLFEFSDFMTFAEDLFKFTGIVSWLMYFSSVTANTIRLYWIGQRHHG